MALNNYLDPAIIASLQTGGYIVMLVLMIIEGPIVTFIAAFLASLGIFNIWIVFTLGWLGDILGDLLFYSIGRYGFRVFQRKTTADTQAKTSLIRKLDCIIQTNLALAILTIKFTPYAPPIGLTYIGKIGIGVKKYLLYSAILSVPIPLVTSLIGFHLGRVNDILTKYSGITLILYISWLLGVILFCGVVIYFLRRKSLNTLEKIPTSEKIEKDTRSA